MTKQLNEIVREEMSCCPTIILNNVEVQSNGILRNSKGRLIARLVDSAEYGGEHVSGCNELTTKQTETLILESVKEWVRVEANKLTGEYNDTKGIYVMGKLDVMSDLIKHLSEQIEIIKH